MLLRQRRIPEEVEPRWFYLQPGKTELMPGGRGECLRAVSTFLACDQWMVDQTHNLLPPVNRKAFSSSVGGRHSWFYSCAHHLQAGLLGTTLTQLRPGAYQEAEAGSHYSTFCIKTPKCSGPCSFQQFPLCCLSRARGLLLVSHSEGQTNCSWRSIDWSL